MATIHLEKLQLKNLNTLDKGDLMNKLLNSGSGFDILFQVLLQT